MGDFIESILPVRDLSTLTLTRNTWFEALAEQRKYCERFLEEDECELKYGTAKAKAELLFKEVENHLKEFDGSFEAPTLDKNTLFNTSDIQVPLLIHEYEASTGYRVFTLFTFKGSRYGEFTGAEGQAYFPRRMGQFRDAADIKMDRELELQDDKEHNNDNRKEMLLTRFKVEGKNIRSQKMKLRLQKEYYEKLEALRAQDEWCNAATWEMGGLPWTGEKRLSQDLMTSAST